MIESAEIDLTFASPPTMASERTSSLGSRLPSTIQMPAGPEALLGAWSARKATQCRSGRGRPVAKSRTLPARIGLPSRSTASRVTVTEYTVWGSRRVWGASSTRRLSPGSGRRLKRTEGETLTAPASERRSMARVKLRERVVAGSTFCSPAPGELPASSGADSVRNVQPWLKELTLPAASR